MRVKLCMFVQTKNCFWDYFSLLLSRCFPFFHVSEILKKPLFLVKFCNLFYFWNSMCGLLFCFLGPVAFHELWMSVHPCYTVANYPTLSILALWEDHSTLWVWKDVQLSRSPHCEKEKDSDKKVCKLNKEAAGVLRTTDWPPQSPDLKIT